MTIKAQNLCGEIRHYFAPVNAGAQLLICRCGELAHHPIHLEPGDRDGRQAAIDATLNQGRRVRNAAA